MGSCLSSKNDGVALGRHPLASSSGGTWSSSNATTKTKTKKTTKDRASTTSSSTTTAFQGTVSQPPHYFSILGEEGSETLIRRLGLFVRSLFRFYYLVVLVERGRED